MLDTPEVLVRKNIGGRLTAAGWAAQDPGDEPASMLLERVGEETKMEIG